jgi:hypothetical protein
MRPSERRISPRKECRIPVRFRVLPNGLHRMAQSDAGGPNRLAVIPRPASGILEGEAVNLSERGILFLSRDDMEVGMPLEMYLTLPRELTGRRSEEVRCSARVVHVESSVDGLGRRGVGACVEKFEPMTAARNWAN